MSKLALIVGVVALLAVLGAGMYVTDFTAYLGNNPSTCNNCHVMDAVYEGWYHAGHHTVAVCGDCHTPHALIPKYYVKALSGYHHVTAFVSGNIPPAIRAKPSSDKVIQENCIRCHADTVENIMMGVQPFDSAQGGPFERNCWDCHRDVAHGKRGISLYPTQHKEEGK
ncbi:MAG: cytochrome c nitrite reductase small subunit [Anaerolineales bacterium]|nr:cytochrome c nitrite reductase small subunit [Anaerolineales bacterium]